MKDIWVRVFSIFFILLGVGFLIFVLKMVWFPPSSMGMMMNREMMMHHVFFMFSQTLLFTLIFIGIVVLILKLKKRK